MVATYDGGWFMGWLNSLLKGTRTNKKKETVKKPRGNWISVAVLRIHLSDFAKSPLLAFQTRECFCLSQVAKISGIIKPFHTPGRWILV